jgi:tRNA pseudouridine55 synthase
VHVKGAAVLPWCPARVLTDAELTPVKSGADIPRGELVAPIWAVPENYPVPGEPILAMHGAALVALLRNTKAGALRPMANLRGGL